MSPTNDIVIFGASVRAAAFSALRAGLNPWCADLFADRDLQARCSTRQIRSGHYPNNFESLSKQGPSGPWMYTGGLENHPKLVERISEKRALWGNNAAALALARSPTDLADVFRMNEICFPSISSSLKNVPRGGRWLVKPVKGAGGAGIHFVSFYEASRPGKQVYFQEFVEGIPCSAVFIGFQHGAVLLGATRQLVGEAWLHAAPFHYCGSVGPLELNTASQNALEKIGNILSRDCHLRGLFGVDFVLTNDGIPWPVEVNPRYPASVEVLEYALGIRALALHRSAFETGAAFSTTPASVAAIVGRAILFSKSPFEFPEDGPWIHLLANPKSIEEMPDFADIPASGQSIEAGKPILTFFSKGGSVTGCIDDLKLIARDLDHCLHMT